MLNIIQDQQDYNSYNNYRKLESSVAEHCKIKFVKSPSSKVIRVVLIV